ncbi:jg14698 [Pararge aegeria aegeria]|uniref:Jg14698 protein n=1 Tax=Pararge aegeria aegeria TaxID=348720 RepID=A0A8S4SGM1_9NEOP|nr:jg14698 [Pararge aegeria aegeria]
MEPLKVVIVIIKRSSLEFVSSRALATFPYWQTCFLARDHRGFDLISRWTDSGASGRSSMGCHGRPSGGSRALHNKAIQICALAGRRN